MPPPMKRRLARVLRSTRKAASAPAPAVGGGVISVPRPREQAVGPEAEHDQEGDMACQDLQVRLDRGADRLGDAENDRADQRAPHVAEAADDDRLEGIDQARRPDRRVEVRAYREEDAGDGGDG